MEPQNKCTTIRFFIININNEFYTEAADRTIIEVGVRAYNSATQNSEQPSIASDAIGSTTECDWWKEKWEALTNHNDSKKDHFKYNHSWSLAWLRRTKLSATVQKGVDPQKKEEPERCCFVLQESWNMRLFQPQHLHEFDIFFPVFLTMTFQTLPVQNT